MVRKDMCRLVTPPTCFLLCVRTVAFNFVEQQRTPFIVSVTALQYFDIIRLVRRRAESGSDNISRHSPIANNTFELRRPSEAS